jgi:uncharacterized lipoprotein YmbA
MKIQGIMRLVGMLVACAPGGGCADALKTPYPAKAYFLIDPGHPGGSAAAGAAHDGSRAADAGPADAARTTRVLKVRQFRVAAPYDGSAFVYKIGPNQYRSDYYSAFLMSTDRMLTASVRDWLGRSGLFTDVVDAGSGVRTRFSLEGNVSGLYADFTDRRAPRAIVEAQFFLLHDEDAGPQILFVRSYSASAPITGNGAPELVEAWNHACRKMLEDLTADLDRNGPPGVQTSMPHIAATSGPG